MARHPELLIPASSLEVLKTAVVFGADAVYIGGEAFGLRAKAKNFSKEDMMEGIRFAHEHDVKVYVTANILAHNYDLEGVREYFKELKEIKPDALIIADPGVFEIAKEVCPEIERHVSTQANNTNYATYMFWYRQGAVSYTHLDVYKRQVGICPVVRVEDKGFEELKKDVIAYMDEVYPDKNITFKVESRRAKKTYPKKSMEINYDLGEAILYAFPEIRVDVHHPDVLLHVEVREEIYIYSEIIPGPGGMPVSYTHLGRSTESENPWKLLD